MQQGLQRKMFLECHIEGKKVYTCKKEEPKRENSNQKKAWDIPDQTFMSTMVGANEMLDSSHDNPIQDMDLP